MAMNMIWDLECEEDYMDYEEIDLSDEVVPEDLFPGLPDEIAMECLLRVSHTSFPQLQGVCKRWGELVTAKGFYEERKRVGATQNCVCMVQALPEEDVKEEKGGDEEEEGEEKGGGKGDQQEQVQAAPVFGVSVYNVAKRSWARLPPFPEFAQGLPVFCRVVGVDGKLVLLGGWHPTSYEALRAVYVFDFSAQAWRRCADMPAGRSFFACGAIGGRVYVVGGHDDNKNALATADVYSPEEDRWEALPDMSEERDECGAAVLDDKLVVVSGYSTTAQGQFVGSGEVYDPRAGAWTRVEGMWREGISPGPFAVSQGRLYAVQGQNLARYCPDANAWAVLDALPQGGDRIASCATAVCDNLVLMTLPSSGDPTKALVHRRVLGSDESAKWELIPHDDDQFSGLGRACCAVEV